jgi:hypothetical protein
MARTTRENRAQSAAALEWFKLSKSALSRFAAAALAATVAAAAMSCRGLRSTFARSRAGRAADQISRRLRRTPTLDKKPPFDLAQLKRDVLEYTATLEEHPMIGDEQYGGPCACAECRLYSDVDESVLSREGE